MKNIQIENQKEIQQQQQQLEEQSKDKVDVKEVDALQDELKRVRE